ncbi:MAG: hypothetical protein ILO68_04060, partial [Clostridia bacterium]|nr:hypothetical protein [Clostridia bacterium]
SALLFFSEQSLPEMEARVTEAAGNGRSVIPVFLDDVKLPESLNLLLGSSQGILKSRYPDEEEFVRAITGSSVLQDLKITDAQKKASRRGLLFTLIGGAILVAAIALLLVFRPFEGNRIDPDSTLGKLGISGSAESVKRVYLYGDQLFENREDQGIFENSPSTNNGISRMYLPVADTIVERGSLEDANDFSVLVNLEELSLSGDCLSDVTFLAGLEKLRILDLSFQHAPAEMGDPDGYGLSLKGISALQNLEELNLTATPILDGAEELLEIPALSRLLVGPAFMEDVSMEKLAGAKFEIVQVGEIVRTDEEFRAAIQDPEVHLILVQDGSTITVQAGEELTVRKDCNVGGTMWEFVNNGTVHSEGYWECMCTETNNGTIIVEPGGFFCGGMSETHNNGTFIVEAGAIHETERGKVFFQQAGSYVLRGTLGLWTGGGFDHNGGTLQNDGLILIANHPNFFWYRSGSLEATVELAKSFAGSGRVETVLVDDEVNLNDEGD